MFVGDPIRPWAEVWKSVGHEIRIQIGDPAYVRTQNQLEGWLWDQVDIEARLRIWSQIDFGKGRISDVHG